MAAMEKALVRAAGYGALPLSDGGRCGQERAGANAWTSFFLPQLFYSKNFSIYFRK
jgi:hypothetical protein